jgi:two-component system sensor histidine kinase PilS (NtrC family)
VFDLPTLADQTVLTSVIHRSYLQGSPQLTELSLRHANDGLHKIRVRAQLTATRGDDGESLCVVFLQDQRETEARIQTEKLASMGRMSAAVAHEIRNPLAAIAQANALLNEDLQEPRHRQLTAMIQQNSKRLEKIVDDVLNLSRAAPLGNTPSPRLELNAAVETACQDWARQARSSHPPTLALHHEVLLVGFDDEHLRRILVNLLDNALRHVRHPRHGLQVSTTTDGSGRAYLSVWSDGAAMDASVERHLFEPFFSSQSRSSGLGLFICRALCEGHGAAISYRRTRRIVENEPTDGNDFIISFAS